MNEWKWSKGETYYKSARVEKKNINVSDNNNENENEMNENEINENAIKQSLDGFYTNTNLNTNLNSNDEFIEIYSRSGNRREDLDNKISDRELLFQRGTNPFLVNTDYVNDVTIRDNYLKPRNTTSEKNNNIDNNN
jgi:hypothetical protein